MERKVHDQPLWEISYKVLTLWTFTMSIYNNENSKEDWNEGNLATLLIQLF